MFGSVTGRELVVVMVIALVALAGSQLPRLVRSLTAARRDPEPEDPPAGSEDSPSSAKY